MNEIVKQSEQTSQTARNLLYLLGLIVAGFVGGTIAGPIASSLVRTPNDLGDLRKQVDELKKEVERLSSMPYSEFVKLNDRVTLKTGDGRPLQTWGANSIIADSRPDIQRAGKTDWVIGKY